MKTPVLESLFNKVPDLQACSFIKKRLEHRYFPVNLAKLLRTALLPASVIKTYLQETCS